ncbi:fasciclin-like arabinogalactan protein 6 [Curcuma longa]|uniref:fasciclin-like arabinogalactan protein 6 n=1 Tax=Curcuma longa TaxID=136217 RepID=UPI003D9E9CBA
MFSSPTSILLPALVLLSISILLGRATSAIAASAAAPAPSTTATTTPSSSGGGGLNLTSILEKSGHHTTFLRLLRDTRVGEQIESQLNNSFNGLTIFAPTDAAFAGLKQGTLNKLATQEQVALVLYHVLPRYYTVSSFETTSNPVNTQASGRGGVYTINVTSTDSGDRVNVSTGVNETPLRDHLYLTFPLALYSVDEVLLPYQLFGPKAPAPTPGKRPGKSSPSEVEGPAAAADSAPDSAGSLTGVRLEWVCAAAVLVTGNLIL